jgi:GPH family glycoside/pentoside/hexuronide:cation symporter
MITPPIAPPAAISASDKVPLKEKLAYGAGGFAGSVGPNLDNALLRPIFVITLGLSPALMSLFDAIYRIWDALTDALMGSVSDNTRSRWGRRRPYILLGAILVSLWMPVLWMFDPTWNLNTIILYMVATQLVLTVCTTIWNVPYQCLLLEFSADSRERTNAAATRAYFGKVGGFCMGWVWWLTQRPIFYDEAGKPDIIRGAFWVSLAGGLLVLALGSLPALFCRERFYAAAKAQKSVPILDSIKSTMSNRPFWFLIGLALTLSLASSAAQGLAFFVNLIYVCKGDQGLASTIGGLGSTVTLFTGFAAIPLCQWVANRYGKKIATLCTLGLFFLWGTATWVVYNPAYPYLVLITGVIHSIANTAIWVLIPSMTGDVVDHDELQTGQRREGSYAAVFS